MGFLHGWRVCPRCGTEVDVQDGRAACPACGSVYYAQSAPAVAALVTDDAGSYLLARRAIEPYLGLWDLPGGFLDEGEGPLAGLRRELREEAGVDVEPHDFLGAFVDGYGDGGSPSVLNLVWRARILAGEPVPADDVAELRWFAPHELPPPEECAFTWIAPFLAHIASGQ
jgi:ADP-ribose pyrophosphatase YjhB (NUDIX family)